MCVAQAFLNEARRVNPNLYVVAELFSGSEAMDTQFVSKLGINSLIREAMNAWDTSEMSRLVHAYGGQPVGSFSIHTDNLNHDFQTKYDAQFLHDKTASGTLPTERATSSAPTGPANDSHTFGDVCVNVLVKGSRPHALFMDCTHDNPTPMQKRTGQDTLSTAALVAMSVSAVGSVRGFDHLVPKLLDLVKEGRLYARDLPWHSGMCKSIFCFAFNLK